MALEVRSGSLQWATPAKTMLHVDIRAEGETEWRRSTISRVDPLEAFSEIFAKAIEDDAPYGEIADYVEPPPVEISTSTPLILPPVQAPAPAIPLPPAPIDWDAEAQRFIAAIYTVRGQNVRGSMNTWAAAVALTPEDQRSNFDKACAEMVPALNAWEGAVFAERDRARAIEGATLDELHWPILPPGASQFIEWCAAP